MLRVKDLSKSYGDVLALLDVDLEVHRGEIVALLGPNGAGKTTFLSIVAGLRRPDRGEVWVGGIDAARHPQSARRQLGLVSQEIGIYPSVSVRNNLRFFGELAGLRRQCLRRRISEVAEDFLLTELFDRPGQALSGGEARRLHMAMVVLQSPPLLLLDEPTVGLDVAARKRLLRIVRTLAEQGTSVVYSTHYLQEVEQLDAARVAILVKGSIAAAAPIPHLLKQLGGASVELRFDGRPPTHDLPRAVPVGRHGLRVPAGESPTMTAVDLLRRLKPGGSELREIKLIQPSLESVFLAVTLEPSHLPLDQEDAAPSPLKTDSGRS